MRHFKGSSNKLGPLGSWQGDVEPPSIWHKDAQPIHIGTEAALYPAWQAAYAPFRVTSNKLEKVLILNQNQSHIALTVVR